MRDHDAIKRELGELSPRLRRFCWTLTRSAADGDDLAQSALLKALSKLDLYRTDDRLDAWLFKIAHRVWLDQLRAAKRRPTAPPETLERLRGEMAALPDDQRAALALVAIEGFSYRDAAEALDAPIGTVMSRIARARQKLLASSRVAQTELAR